MQLLDLTESALSELSVALMKPTQPPQSPKSLKYSQKSVREVAQSLLDWAVEINPEIEDAKDLRSILKGLLSGERKELSSELN